MAEIPKAASADEAPIGPIETVLAEIWSEVLEIDEIGRNEDFFDLGGHSLLAMHVVTLVWERLGVEISLRALFTASTIQQLAELCQNTEPKGPPIDEMDEGSL